ncbi:MAG: hypothetical protein HS117_14350 [Verrucomicrobiaceae bacterium]|nr:hypothetical protein [Verrucomicrobiaceae bacterium]
MKRLFLPLLSIVLLCGTDSHAQTPLFGSSHSLDTHTYDWTDSTNDGTYQWDNYYSTSSGGTLTIKGKMYAGAAMGEVSGAFTGYYDGSFHPLTQTYSEEAVSVSSPNGRAYTSRTGTTTYAVNLDSSSLMLVSLADTYSGPDGSFTVSGPNGPVQGSESGYMVDGSFYFDSSYSQSWEPGMGPGASHSLFGSTYHHTSQWGSTMYDATGTAATSGGDSYSSDAGGSYTVPSEGDVSGNDPYVGDWVLVSGALGSAPVFASRNAPRFVVDDGARVIWVNAVAVNWVSSSLDDAAGQVTDVWASLDGGIEVTVTGNARDFMVDSQAASVSVSVQGVAGTFTGSITRSGGLGAFSPALDIHLTDPNRDTPLFTVATLYVDNVPFEFAGGYEDAFGNRIDTYGGGALVLTGQVADPEAATVNLTAGGASYTGGFTAGVFTLEPPAPPATTPVPVILTQALVNGPPAFWIDGVLYVHVGGTNSYMSDGAPPHAVALSGTEASALSLNGTHTDGAVSGSYDAVTSGVYAVTVGGAPRIGCPASADGTPQGGGTRPADFPEAVKAEGTTWPFAGLVADDTTGGAPVACYARGRETLEGMPTARLSLLKIREAAATGTRHAVTLRTYGVAGTRTGGYDTASSLFDTLTGTDTALPPMHRTVPPDHTRWLNPGVPAGLPPSFIVRGQPWWYAFTQGGLAVYHGFHTGQQMTVSAPDATTGARAVVLADPLSNSGAATQGSLSDVRVSARLRDGTVVISGNQDGQQQEVTYNDDFTLHTIRSDVDIIGNNLSFGVLQDDASLAGALFSFADQGDGGRAALHQVLARDRAEWVWWKAVAANGMTDWHPVMMVDENHVLRLYPRTPAEFPSIILNPEGTSSFKGPVRVPRGGDIPMGIYQAGGEP